MSYDTPLLTGSGQWRQVVFADKCPPEESEDIYRPYQKPSQIQDAIVLLQRALKILDTQEHIVQVAHNMYSSRPAVEERPQTTPLNISEIEEAFQESSYLLDLDCDWDGKGSPGFRRQTWERAKGFVVEAAHLLWQHGLELPIPEVMPGSRGAIDIQLNHPGCTFLLRIPANTVDLVEYLYEDQYNNMHGRYPSPLQFVRMVQWLMK